MLVGASKALKMNMETEAIANFIISTSCQTDGKIFAFRPNSS